MHSTTMRNKTAGSFFSFCLGTAAILLLIQAGGFTRGNRIVFPGVGEIGQALIRLLSNSETYIRIGKTMLHLMAALAFSLTAGIITGAAEGMFKNVYSFFKPLMILIRALPMIILVILLMTLFPYKQVPVTAGTIALVPVVSEAVYEGFCSVDPELVDVYRLNSGMNFQVFIHVYIPSVAGYLKQAFFNSAGLGLKVVVSAEYLVQANQSLGKAVYSSSYFLEYAEIYAYALIMILLVLLITELPVAYIRFREREKTRKKQQ